MAKQPTAIQQLHQLDKQRQKLLETAKEEALANAEEAVRALNALGFSYRLTASTPRKTAQMKQRRQVKDVPCPICGFKTSPPHDGRAHRSQANKKPFMAEELKERGLTKV